MVLAVNFLQILGFQTDEETGPAKVERILGNMAWSRSIMKGMSAKRRSSHNQTVISEEIFEKARVFRSKKKLEGTIDVYWLYDDGGLTLLLPYILSTRTKYSRSKLRIFFLSNKVEKIEEETKNMSELMAKFRFVILNTPIYISITSS